MPGACPLPLDARLGQASVRFGVSVRLTQRTEVARPNPSQHRLRTWTSSRLSRCLCSDALKHDLAAASYFRLHQRTAFASIRTSTSTARLPQTPNRSASTAKIYHRTGPTNLLGAILADAAERGIGPHLQKRNHLPLSAFQSFDWVSLQDEEPTQGLVEPAVKIIFDRAANLRSKSGRDLRVLTARQISARFELSAADGEQPTTKDLHLTAKEKRHLQRHGYDEHDVQKWVSILMAKDSYRAAQSLLDCLGENQDGKGVSAKYMPTFVLLFVLRRTQISPQALRLLIVYTTKWLEAVQRQEATADRSQPGYGPEMRPKPTVAVRIFTDLISHAQKVWPEALEPLAEHLTKFVTLGDSARAVIEDGGMPSDSLARLTSLYNRLLYLFSRPTAIAPFKSTIFQEAAQTRLLACMASHRPSLVINREGYRSVIAVQLARKKTETEMEWARLKSPSWPPWKEDRTGMDALVDIEYGITRAGQVLNRMQEAGYPLREWEKVARIYAGWDTDGSPTVQTRKSMSPSLRKLRKEEWAARIRCTRTVQEAWACFLAYEDEIHHPAPEVYFAMFEKVISERKRIATQQRYYDLPAYRRRMTTIYAGDAKETFPPPASSHQATYTRSEPPKFEELYERMLQHNVRPEGHLLALLLNNTNSLSLGRSILRHASDPNISSLADVWTEHDTRSVPNSIFTAFIGLLCRGHVHSKVHDITRVTSPDYPFHFHGWSLDPRNPKVLALRFLIPDKRLYRPAWNRLLAALASRSKGHFILFFDHQNERTQFVGTAEYVQILDRLAAFNVMQHTIFIMRESDLWLDEAGFVSLCWAATHAITASKVVLRRFGLSNEDDIYSADLSDEDKRICLVAQEVTSVSSFVQREFHTMVQAVYLDLPRSAIASTLPRLPTTPSYALLHLYARTLGHLGDHHALRELVAWMVEYKPELSQKQSEDRNGEAMMRKTIVAIRVFLEAGWIEATSSQDVRHGDAAVNVNGTESHATPEALVDEIVEMVESVDEWGGWPSDEECEVYMASHRA